MLWFHLDNLMLWKMTVFLFNLLVNESVWGISLLRKFQGFVFKIFLDWVVYIYIYKCVSHEIIIQILCRNFSDSVYLFSANRWSIYDSINNRGLDRIWVGVQLRTLGSFSALRMPDIMLCSTDRFQLRSECEAGPPSWRTDRGTDCQLGPDTKRRTRWGHILRKRENPSCQKWAQRLGHSRDSCDF